jgi:putative ABC transport system permease protein
LKEESQDLVGFRFETALQDFRYGLRQLRKNPGFTVTASFILALGIGASTAIFSAVSPILFESLPYPDAGRLMMVWESRDGVNTSFPSFGTYHGIAERTQSFEVLAAMKPWQPTMTTAAEPERIEGQRVTSGFFRTLGVAPALGRDFLGSEDIYLGPNVIILSHSVWQRRFASDSAVIGREVKLDGTLFTVIGVMPEGFENVLSPEAEIWAPLQYNSTLPPNSREWGHHLRVVGRLRSGVTRSQAAAELNVILHNLGQAYINGFNEAGGPPRNFLVNRLQDDVTSEVRPVLLAVLGAVLLVLAIACVNVTNLLLARGGRRRGEFAMRSALGAARSRLMRQLLTESLLLGGIGGAFGIAVAYAAVRGLVALSPPGLPRLSDIRLSGFVYLFALGVTTLVGMVVGLVPALQASHSGLHATMQESSRRTAGGHEWTRRALVVAEVSLAVVLLVGAGLLVRTLHRLFSLDTGFDPSHVITMQVQESGPGYRKDEDRLRFFEQALERVRQLPGIEQAAFVNQLPLSGDYEVYGVEFQNDAGNGGTAAFRYAVTPRYFETMRIPLRSGRLFTEQDTAGSAKVALINESLAKRIFAGKDPIGQAFHAGPDLGKPNRPWTTIIGVVADVKHASLQVGSQDSFYTPNSQWAWADTTMTLVARTQGDAATLAPDIRRGIWSIDKDLAIVRVQTMEQIVKASEVQRRFAMTIFEVFALVALVLAATGIYGVLAGSVTERIREIGVRAALGASRGAILALIIRQGMTLTGLGILVGLVGAMAATRALITLLFGISRLDPVTYIGAIALLTGVSGVACAIPAWRAARVDPSIALRAE